MSCSLLYQVHTIIVAIWVCRDICNGLVNFIGKLGPVSFLYVEASSERVIRGSDWRSDSDCDRTVLWTWDGVQYSSLAH